MRSEKLDLPLRLKILNYYKKNFATLKSEESRISLGEILKSFNEAGERLVHIAAREGEMEILNFLIDAIDTKETSEQNKEIFLTDKNGKHLFYYLVWNNNLPFLENFLTRNKIRMDLNQQDLMGNTILHHAVLENLEDNKIAFLIQRGARLDIKNNEGQNPLYLAAKQRNNSAIAIIRNTDPTAVLFAFCLQINESGKTALEEALSQNRTDILMAAQQLKSRHLSNMWHVIIKEPILIHGLLKLLGDNAQPFETDDHGNNVLHLASQITEDSSIHVFLNYLHRNPKQSDLVTINQLNRENKSPYQISKEAEKENITKRLVELGAEIEPKKIGEEVLNEYKKGNTPLHIAMIKNDLPSIENLLLAGARLGKRNHEGKTPLDITPLENKENIVQLISQIKDENNNSITHLAILNNDEESLRELLEYSFCLDYINNDGDTPLLLAVKQRQTALALAIIRSDKLTPRIININDAGGYNAALIAGATQQSIITDELIALGSDITSHDEPYNETALHLAIARNDLDTVRLLSLYGAALDIRDEQGNTPLLLAAKLRNSEALAQIISYASKLDQYAIDMKDLESAKNILEIAVINGDIASLEYLISFMDMRQNSLLHIAINENKIDLIHPLISLHPFNLNLSNRDGETPLITAVKQENVEAVKAIIDATELDFEDKKTSEALKIAKEKSAEITELLLEASKRETKKSKIEKNNTKDSHNPFLLHYFARTGNHEMVLALITKEKYNPSLPDTEGQNVFHHAALYCLEKQDPNTTILYFLRENYPDLIMQKDNHNKTPLDYLQEYLNHAQEFKNEGTAPEEQTVSLPKKARRKFTDTKAIQEKIEQARTAFFEKDYGAARNLIEELVDQNVSFEKNIDPEKLMLDHAVSSQNFEMADFFFDLIFKQSEIPGTDTHTAGIEPLLFQNNRRKR